MGLLWAKLYCIGIRMESCGYKGMGNSWNELIIVKHAGRILGESIWMDHVNVGGVKDR